MGIDRKDKIWDEGANGKRGGWLYKHTCDACGTTKYATLRGKTTWLCPNCKRIRKARRKLTKEQIARVDWDSARRRRRTWVYRIRCRECLQFKQGFHILTAVDQVCLECSTLGRAKAKLTAEQIGRVHWDSCVIKDNRRYVLVDCVQCGNLKEEFVRLAHVDWLCKACRRDNKRGAIKHVGHPNVDYTKPKVSARGVTLYPISCLVCGKPKGLQELRHWDIPCSECASTSKGEEVIARLLRGLDVPFIREHTCRGLRRKRKLWFDFYIEEPQIAIEYNGEQHYCPTEFFGGVAAFLKTIKCDKAKAKYCDSNGIHLIVIPHWDYDRIEEILREELTKLGVLTHGSTPAI